MFKQLLTGGSVLALLLVGGFSAQAKPQASLLQAQTQEAPFPDTQTTPPAGTIEPGTSPEGTTAPEPTAPDATTPVPDTSPEGTTTPDVTPDAGTPETTSPDSSGTPTPESQTSTPDSNTDRAGIFCESNPIAEPTGGGSREFRQCQ